jgi:hypothetical protein
MALCGYGYLNDAMSTSFLKPSRRAIVVVGEEKTPPETIPFCVAAKRSP